MKKIIFAYDKKVENDDYVILFNTKTGQELLSGKDGKPDPFSLEYPSMIDVGIMGHCKNKCEFCYQGDDSEPNMSLLDFKRLIHASKDHVMQVALGGRGDPNHHEYFEQILRYARENGVVPNYTTSGNGLTDEQIEISKKYCGAVAVSMLKKDFTYSSLNRLMDAGVKTNIHQLFSKNTFSDVISIIEGNDVWDGLVDVERLNAVIFLLFKPQGRGKNLDWHPTDLQLETFARLIEQPKSKFKIGLDSCLVNKVANVRELTESEELYVDSCEAARMSCYVTPDMRLMPCSFGCRDQYGKNIVPTNKAMIKLAWDEGESFKDFREILNKDRFICPYDKKGW